MTQELEDNKFTWNDYVLVKPSAPVEFYPGKPAYVCGMEKVKFKELAEEYHVNIGEWIYTIEFDSGKAIVIPEYYLEKTDEPTD